jgi:hypothetical protein
MSQAAVRQAPLKGGSVRDFSGGPNLRDAAPELGQNELVDSWNVTLDERGGVTSRLGRAKYNSSVYGGGLVSNQFYSSVAADLLTQAGASLYKGTSTVAVKTFTTSARVGFAEIAGKIVAGHPVDGLFTSTDGITWAAVVDVDAPKGNALETWQNKLYVAGQGTARVSWSDAGDPTSWTATSFNDLRSKDNEKVVALKVASGLDISGRAGLVACKQESTYRIFDSTTGAYEVIDATVGAASALAIVQVGAKLITLSKRGIFWWSEGQVGMVNASDRLQPLWDPGQINLAQLDLFCSGRRGNRARFSLCRAGSTANDLSLEYHPEQGWIAPGSNAFSCYATSTGAAEVVYGGSPTVSGQAYIQNSGGTDDGVAISYRIQTRWFELSDGFLASVWQIRLHGRGSGTMTVRTDYASAGGTDYPFDLTQAGARYDTGLHWDSFYYVIPSYQETQAFYSIGPCRQFSLLFTGSTSTTTSAAQVLGAGTAPVVGSVAIYGAEWLWVPLGLS